MAASPDRGAAERAAAQARIEHQDTWVDLQLRRARERGDFDDLPGFGKPIEGLGDQHDPDWWVRRLVEREQVVVLPPSVQLRREDAGLDDALDRLGGEAEVRRAVLDFNARVRWALYRPPEGPPVITAQRDPDAEVARWRDRRADRTVRRTASAPEPRRRGWWRRRKPVDTTPR